MSANEKLAMLIDEMGRGAQRRLAEHLGENPVNVNRWVKGTRPIPQKRLKDIAKFFGVSVDYLLDDDQTVPLSRFIPLIGEASCGVPMNSFYENADEWLPVPSELAGEGVYAVRAYGESMSPKIRHGDIVICDKEAEVRNGDIVHYTVDNSESGIKKILFSEDGMTVTLIPLNTDCENCNPITINLDTHSLHVSKCKKVLADL